MLLLASSVGNQTGSRCPYSVSTAEWSAPISNKRTPFGFSRAPACPIIFLIISMPSVPPSKAMRGSFLNSGGKVFISAVGSYGGLLIIRSYRSSGTSSKQSDLYSLTRFSIRCSRIFRAATVIASGESSIASTFALRQLCASRMARHPDPVQTSTARFTPTSPFGNQCDNCCGMISKK